MKIIIREAQIEDCPIIAKAIAMAIGEESVKEYCGENYLEILEEVARTSGTQYCFTNALVCQANGVLCGAIIGYDGAQLYELREKTLSIIYKDREIPSDFPDETEAGEFYLDSLGVLPECRGLEIGRELILQMRRHAFEKGFKKVGLIVDKENPRAEKMYSSIGFDRIGTKIFFSHQMWHMQSENPV